MKLFGTTQPFVESEEDSFKIGRLVANYDFFIALFKYSDFDEFHIFCPTFANCKLTEKKISQEDIPSSCKAKIKIFHISLLKRAISENKYYVFHLGGWGYFFPGFVHLRNRYAVRPFPITGVTHSLNDKQSSFYAFKVCNAPVMPFDSIVCTSNCGKRVLKNLLEATEKNFKQTDVKYRGRLDIIPLGINDSHRIIPDRIESRELVGIDKDSFVILSLGRLTSDNKMDFAPFLAAMKRFITKNKKRKIIFILAGSADAQDRKFIKSILRENQLEEIVNLFVNIEDYQKAVLYSAADVYISAIDNFQETFGLSVLEAMAYECAVVVSDFNGYSETVDHEINGIKIPTFWSDITEDLREVSEIMNFPTHQLYLSQSVVVDFDEMLNSLQKLIENPDKCIQLGKSARQKVEQKYFWSDVIKQYCNLWDELSKQSDNFSAEIEKPKNPWEIDYYSVFSHYPSGIVNEDSRISLSEYGREVLISGNIPVAYSDISAIVIVPQLVALVLKAVNQNIVTVKQIAHSLQQKALISDTEAMYYVLWMAKYNLVNIDNNVIS